MTLEQVNRAMPPEDWRSATRLWLGFMVAIAVIFHRSSVNSGSRRCSRGTEPLRDRWRTSLDNEMRKARDAFAQAAHREMGTVANG